MIAERGEDILNISDNINSIIHNLTPSVTLVAVTKTRSISEMQEAYNFGIRDFGENKVQELMEKYDEFPDVRWHFIGKLQKNKVKYLVDKAYLIHSLDSVSLLEEVEKQYGKKNKIANMLIEINIGEETSKAGIMLNDLEELVKAIEKCKFVKINGFMAIIPKGDEKMCRYYFKRMKKLWDEFSVENYQNINMKYLSMGMTNDYNIAIEEGSNIIRIGEGIFGKRNK